MREASRKFSGSRNNFGKVLHCVLRGPLELEALRQFATIFFYFIHFILKIL